MLYLLVHYITNNNFERLALHCMQKLSVWATALNKALLVMYTLF